MQEARQCLQTLETPRAGPLLEARQLKLQLTRAHSERDIDSNPDTVHSRATGIQSCMPGT